MKKTVSINLNGQIFNVEENGYEILKNYLVSITKYFSNYAGSKEILADIEGRIAEKFYENMVKGGTQVITKNNVESLIASMGTTADFEAVREENDLIEKEEIEVKQNEIAKSFETKTANEQLSSESSIKKLYRDGKQKSIAGVASGMAHYFKIDVIWVRLAFICAVLLVPIWANFNLEFLSGISIILYMACWVAFPIKNDFEENTNIIKLYRDPKNKVMAGVASGISNYLNIDISLVRLGFILTTFLFGIGILLYLAFWVVTPFANSITQKMQMKGEAITINNIEKAVAASSQVKENDESALSKLLLFPFRAIGAVINAILPIFKSFGSIIRVIFGITITFISIISQFSIVASLVALLGVFGYSNIHLGDLPVQNLMDEFPKNGIFMAFFVLIIPFFALGYLGFSIIMNKNYFNKNGVITLGAIWLISTFALGSTVGNLVRNFRAEESITTEQILPISKGNLTIMRDDEEKRHNNFKNINIRFVPSADNVFRIVKKVTCNGSTEKEALENANKLSFKTSFKNDSILFIPRTIILAENERFRNQHVEIFIQIPKGRIINIEENMRFDNNMNDIFEDGEILKNENFVDKEFYRYKMGEEGLENVNDKYKAELDNNTGSFSQNVPVDMFNSINVNGEEAEVTVNYGEEQKIEIFADSKNTLADLKSNIEVEDNNLKIENYNNGKPKIIITTPFLRNIKLGGSIKIIVDSKGNKFKELNVNLEGDTELVWTGNIEKLNLNTNENSIFVMENSIIEKLNLETWQQSSVKIKQANKANILMHNSSKVEFLNKPQSINSKKESEEAQLIIPEK